MSVFSKFHRRDRRALRREQEQRIVMATQCTTTGATTVVPTTHAVSARYMALHEHLPRDLTEWPKDKLEAMLTETDSNEDWERTLIFMAHHKSAWACTLLRELQGVVPAALESFAELAYAESLAWLGFDYVREFGQTAPTITA